MRSRITHIAWLLWGGDAGANFNISDDVTFVRGITIKGDGVAVDHEVRSDQTAKIGDGLA